MFSPKITYNKGNYEPNGAEKEDAGHTGFNSPVVCIGRKPADKIVTQASYNDVTYKADEESDSDVFHVIFFDQRILWLGLSC
jgi:hypothetical protein